MTFYEDIRRVRKQSGHSQEFLAGKSDITRAYLGKIEKDGAKDRVTIATLKRIASALGKKVMVIFYE